MSIESWLKEFYPLPVEDVPVSEATAHSLQKWKGTEPQALLKHEVFFSFHREITDSMGSDYFAFHAKSCALCHHHLQTGCQSCPIFLYKRSLDPEFEFDDEACEKEYILAGGGFNCPGTTKPMIDLLEATLRFEQAQKTPDTDTGG